MEGGKWDIAPKGSATASRSRLSSFRRLSSHLRSLLLPGILFCSVQLLHGQPVGPQQQVTIEYADEFRGRVENGEQVVEAIGNVRGRQGATEISAQRAIHYPASNRATLIGSVRIAQPGTVLTAPRVEYDGNARTATTPDGVVIRDGDADISANHATYNLYNRVASFAGGVTMADPQARLRAASGEYYSSERRADFHGGVRVESDSGTIEAQELTYWRDSQEMTATGDVVVRPRDRHATLTGDRLRHMPRIGYTLVTGAARLVDIDTSEAGEIDTAVITSAKMEAFRTAEHEEYIGTDSVRLVRGKLEAVAHAAYYLPEEEVIALGSGRLAGAPAPTPGDSLADTAAVTGRDPRDTSGGGARGGAAADTGATGADRSPERFASGVFPVVWYDRSQLSGDTITVRLKEKELRSIEVIGDAMAVSATDFSERYDQLAGDRVTFSILRDTIRHIGADGMASILSFMSDEGKPNGVTRNSGERIEIHFAAGDPSRIVIRKVAGRMRNEGESIPESLVAGAETTYRLQGFRWIERETAHSE